MKRVPVDFDHPLNEIWPGFQMPEELWRELDCPDCEKGYSARASYLHDLWYGNVHFEPYENGSTPFEPETPEIWRFAERNVTRDESSRRFYTREYFRGATVEEAIALEARRLADLQNGQWAHHLNQADVDALVESGRLMDFTHRIEKGKGWVKIEPRPEITAEAVNRWSLIGFGHDSINAVRAIQARCEREGVSDTCATCDGHGSIERFPGQRAEAERWERTEPPTGEGWQLWETVSEGSPISPVFHSAEGLARWMSSPDYAWGAARPMAYSAALKFVTGFGWAPSFIGDSGGLHRGEEYVGAKAVLDELETELEG